MKIGLLGFLVFIAPSIVFGGELTARVQQAYRSTPALRADFVQKTYVQLLEKEVEERGSLVIATPNRFLIHYHGRQERKYISNGKKLWIVYPLEGEVETISNLSEVMSREALAFLNGLGEMEQEFRVTEGNNPPVLTLVPRSGASPFRKIVLGINKSFLADEVTLFPKSGNRSRYRFSHLRKEPAVGDLFHP